jgi:dUTP pyrophosphatase
MFPTGFAVEVPQGYELQVRSRSGLAKQGLFVTNSPGTIDSDYRGEICVLLSNLDPNRSYTVNRGDRIAQLVLCEVPRLSIQEVEELSSTERGEGGFGSTGA